MREFDYRIIVGDDFLKGEGEIPMEKDHRRLLTPRTPSTDLGLPTVHLP